MPRVTGTITFDIHTDNIPRSVDDRLTVADAIEAVRAEAETLSCIDIIDVHIPEQYLVVLSSDHTSDLRFLADHPHRRGVTVLGYNGTASTYTRSEAIKKASMFGGKIEAAKF
jgi:hypothetical protein